MAAEKQSVQLLSGLIVVLTFVFGTIAGIGLDRSFLARHQGPRHGPGDLGRDGREPGPPQPGHAPLPPYLEDLDLTDAQEKKVQEVLEKYRPQLEALVRESFPKVRAINDKLDAEVRAQLTPEQQKQLDARPRHHVHGMHGPGMPGGPGMGPPGMGPPGGAPGMGPPGMPPPEDRMPPPPREDGPREWLLGPDAGR
ncbi:MAG: hypothetical protein JST92_26265 [Deltaproteobacteria bacterium]|nr:hypothetical protein [Deltaproteobacteria bacterium]